MAFFLDKGSFKDERKEGFQGKATVGSVLSALFSLPQLCVGLDMDPNGRFSSRGSWDNFPGLHRQQLMQASCSTR